MRKQKLQMEMQRQAQQTWTRTESQSSQCLAWMCQMYIRSVLTSQAIDVQMTEQMDARNEETEAANGDAKAGPADMDEDRKPEQPMFSLDNAPATRAEQVGSSTPVEDFQSLKRDHPDKAFSGLASIIGTLVARSLGDRCRSHTNRCLDLAWCSCARRCMLRHAYISTYRSCNGTASRIVGNE